MHTATQKQIKHIDDINFYMRNQQQGEPVEQYVTDFKLKAFDDMSDSMILDRIVLGIARLMN